MGLIKVKLQVSSGLSWDGCPIPAEADSDCLNRRAVTAIFS